MSRSCRIESLCVLVLCTLGLLAPGGALAQSGQAQAAVAPRNATAGSEQHPVTRGQSELDGCLTSDGRMPKLSLFRSSKIYRLEARAGLLMENPLTFANNFGALVHVTGHMGPEADIYDPDHSPVFIVNGIDKLAPTCDVKGSVAQLRKQLEKSKSRAGTASRAPAQIRSTDVVDMTGQLLVFEPAVIEIRVGQTVTWKNSSAQVHTVTADPSQATNAHDVELPKGAQAFHSGYMNPGQNYQHTFRKPGIYRYVCTLHEVQHMTGKIIVKP